MPKPIIEIKNFSSGISSDPSKPSGFAALNGCDIHTVAGELNVSAAMNPDSDTIFTTNADYLNWMEPYDANGGTYEMYGYGQGGSLYRKTGGAWADIHTVTNGGGEGLKAFGDSLYYTTSDKLGQLQGDPTVGGNYNDTFQALSGSTFTYAPMAIFVGSLFVGSGRYIDRLDSNETTWETKVLTLPKGYSISAMTVWNDKLVITTSSGTHVSEDKVFFWDGVSEFWSLDVGIPFGGDALFNFNNILLLFINFTIYSFTGSDFQPFLSLPKVGIDFDQIRSIKVRPGAIAQYRDRLLFGIACTNVAVDNIFPAGIYSIGRRSSNQPFALSLEFLPSTGSTGDVLFSALATVPATNNRAVDLYASYFDQDNTLYVLDIIDSDAPIVSGAYVITPAYEIQNNDSGRLVKGVRIENNGDMSTSSTVDNIKVYYRKDEDIDYERDDVNWTYLGQIDNDSSANNNQGDILYGIYEKAQRIQLKLDFTTGNVASSNMRPRRILIY